MPLSPTGLDWMFLKGMSCVSLAAVNLSLT